MKFEINDDGQWDLTGLSPREAFALVVLLASTPTRHSKSTVDNDIQTLFEVTSDALDEEYGFAEVGKFMIGTKSVAGNTVDNAFVYFPEPAEYPPGVV